MMDWIYFLLCTYLLVAPTHIECAPADDLVQVTCGSCPDKASKSLVGVKGGSLIVSYNIKDIYQVQLLKISYGGDSVDVGYIGDNKYRVNHDTFKEKRLTVPVVTKVVKGKSVVVSVTLNQLSMKDVDTVFTYELTTKGLQESKGKNVISIQAPPTFCDAPKTSYNILAEKAHVVQFAVCGNPQPSKVKATFGTTELSVNLVVVARHKFYYNVSVTAQKGQCGQQLNFTAYGLTTVSVQSTVKLMYKPDMVRNVTAHRDENNLLNVVWSAVQKYGDCPLKYYVKRVHNGTPPEVHGTTYLNYPFHNAAGNNTITVWADVNGMAGPPSLPITIFEDNLPTSSPVIGDNGSLAFEYILAIIVVVLLIVGLLLVAFICCRRKKRKEGGVILVPTNNNDVVEFAEDNSQLEKLAGKHDDNYYAELGPGGEVRASQRSGLPPSLRASQRSAAAPASMRGLDAASLHPSLRGSGRSLGKDSNKSDKPLVAKESASSKKEDSFDQESSMMI